VTYSATGWYSPSRLTHARPDSVAPDLPAPTILEAAERARIGVVISSGSGPDRVLRFVSPSVAELLGTTSEQLMAGSATAPFPPEQRAQHERWRDERLSSEDSASLAGELLDSRAARIPVAISASSAELDGQRVLIEFVVDRREHRSTELALSKSEARFRELIEAAPEAVAIRDGDRLAYANSAALRLLGYDEPNELQRIPPDEYLHPDDRPVVARCMRELLQGATPAPFNIRLRRRDRRWVEVEIVAMLIEWDGRPAALSIARDLGERRQLQAQLVQADRLAAIGTLAAGVAHEINNPLAYVLLNLEYLIRELPKLAQDPSGLARLVERLGEARHGAERVSAIVRDLRAFAREDREVRAAVDLKLVLASAAKIAAPEIAARGRLIEEYEDGARVLANAARLEQVFLNLLLNAGQALPPAPGPGEVRVSLSSRGARVLVEVTDNGAGIPPELLDRVFDPFFSTKPIGMGTGLGLPICHAIVTALGGEITVQSQLGRGTVFCVSLPRLREPFRSVTPAPSSQPVPSGPRVRVLIVDDELPVATMLARVLTEHHDVRLTTSGAEALALLLSEEFEVVLCDLLMPGMSGMDLYRELAQKRPGVESRLVFMTGGAFTPRAAEFLASVDNARLEKPFDLARMRSLVELAARRSSKPS
jgi:two-component system, cell cycle sensor histidine kinase and response regulator CckA